MEVLLMFKKYVRCIYDYDYDITHRIHVCYIWYSNIYHQYTPNVSIYTIHGSYDISGQVLRQSPRKCRGAKSLDPTFGTSRP